jgi:predicted phage terminase large subunit-like protein
VTDYSVCTTWGLKDKHFYLLNVFRKKLAYPDLKRAVREQAQLFKAIVILIEDKASGTQLIQELIEEGLHAVTRFKPEGDKVMRLHAQTAAIENGFVFVPNDAHWLADYLHELTTFPNGKYDDQVDSTSQALAWSKHRPSNWGLLEYYRREVEKLSGPSILRIVRLRAPPGFDTAITSTGRTLSVSSDGTIAVTEEEATGLLMAGFQRV